MPAEPFFWWQASLTFGETFKKHFTPGFSCSHSLGDSDKLRQLEKKKKINPLQKPFLLCLLSVCSQRFRNEILKSQPSHKTAGNMNSVPFLSQLGSGFENCFCPSPKNKTKLQSCHHNKEENFFLTTLQHTTHEGAQSSACLTLVRPDLEVLLTLQTPAALHLMSASLFRFRKASFTYNTRYFFLIAQLQLYLIYHFSSWQPLLS